MQRRLHTALAFFAGLLAASSAFAASISPSSVNATMDVGESLTIHKTITLESTLYLVFGVSATFPGVSVGFTCTDPLGCANVGGGESRTFDVTITGLTPGTYEFDVFALGVAAFEHDTITVTGAVSVPEPGSLVLMGLGLAALGFARRRKV